ncbi:DUF1127 domain-containing protein [Acerihabitans sp. TG2]|uniref:DUF1127 domain-containing protein n=1 Tax=Acerihabitans sp. TG2 TaxID=3096008 RepID=UPI002B22D778|nr:DUF1127 domain-containing protein [Acerihabitans sp. TG2]MEA9390006.1 DUF1127 domain-containing protein [Acerihabitans sp. TG2]
MKNTPQTGRDYANIPETQANYDDEASVTWWRRLYGNYQNWRWKNRSRRSLMSLSDAQLQDIGLSRSDLPYRDKRK